MTKYSELTGRMTLEQKATLITATGGWSKITAPDISVSALAFSDGSRGVKVKRGHKHFGAPTTSFPAPSAMARSWSTPLYAKTANVIGNEARALGVNALFAPEGRICEDPYLSGKMLAAYVRGVQNNDVMAAVSLGAEGLTPKLSKCEKALREIALQPAEMAVKEGEARMVRIPSQSVSESRHVLGGILRTEWQFGGTVISTDEGGLNLCAAFAAGAHMIFSNASSVETQRIVAAVNKYKKLSAESGDGAISEKLSSAVAAGEALPESAVDSVVEKILAAADAAEVEARMGEAYASYPVGHQVMFDEQTHAEMAVTAACECVTLLKNTDGVLPLTSEIKAVFFGEYLFMPLAAVGGDFVPLDVETVSQVLPKSGLNVIGMAKGFESGVSEKDNAKLGAEAVAMAGAADVAVVLAGDLTDNASGEITAAQLDLIRDIRRNTGAKIVAVCLGECPSDMSWNDICDAVILAGDLGQGGARAIVRVLNGMTSPSGKLAHTVCDKPLAPIYEHEMFGYRLCQAANVEERYPFGFGLGYTEFEYSDIKVKASGVSFTLKNTGGRAGAEVCQLYVGRENSAVTGVRKELKGFCKVFLEAGESKSVHIPFDSKTFRYYNTQTRAWESEGGIYQIFVASSSRMIELFADLGVNGSGAPIPEYGAGTQPTDDPKNGKNKKKSADAVVFSDYGAYKADAVYTGDRDMFDFLDGHMENNADTEADVLTEPMAEEVAEVIDECTESGAEVRVLRHTAADTMEAGLSKLFEAWRTYIDTLGVTADTDDLRDLFAAVLSAGTVAVRCDDRQAVRTVLEGLSACLECKATEDGDTVFVCFTGEKDTVCRVMVIGDAECAGGAHACTVRLRAHKSQAKSGALETYPLGAKALADMLARERDRSYLSEKYWRKIDKLEARLSKLGAARLDNKTLNTMEKFIAVSVCCGAEQTDALDSAAASMVLGAVPSACAKEIDGEESLAEFMDGIFGADTDARCREMAALKGFK